MSENVVADKTSVTSVLVRLLPFYPVTVSFTKYPLPVHISTGIFLTVIFGHLVLFHKRGWDTLGSLPVLFCDISVPVIEIIHIFMTFQLLDMLHIWSSRVPFGCKKKEIDGDLHRAKTIASNFLSEAARIKAKFLKAVFPHKIIENAINNFTNAIEELIITTWFLMKEKHL